MLTPLTPVMFASIYPADIASESEYFGNVEGVGVAGAGEDGKLGVDVGGTVEGVGVMVDHGAGVDEVGGGACSYIRVGTAITRK
jgi:hypothetical protein